MGIVFFWLENGLYIYRKKYFSSLFISPCVFSFKKQILIRLRNSRQKLIKAISLIFKILIKHVNYLRVPRKWFWFNNFSNVVLCHIDYCQIR